MKRFQTKQVHLSTDDRKPEHYTIEDKGSGSGMSGQGYWYTTIFKTACGNECLRPMIRMRTNEVTCKRCIATERYKNQLALDNKR